MGSYASINRQDMSGQGVEAISGGELQDIDLGCGLFTQPAVWTYPATSQVWVFVTSACGMRAYQVQTNASGVTRLAQAWTNGDTLTSPVIAGGVLFAAGSGALRAYDPTTGHALWSSDQASAGGSIGAIHWESPIVVDGPSTSPTERDDHLLRVARVARRSEGWRAHSGRRRWM